MIRPGGVFHALISSFFGRFQPTALHNFIVRFHRNWNHFTNNGPTLAALHEAEVDPFEMIGSRTIAHGKIQLVDACQGNTAAN